MPRYRPAPSALAVVCPGHHAHRGSPVTHRGQLGQRSRTNRVHRHNNAHNALTQCTQCTNTLHNAHTTQCAQTPYTMHTNVMSSTPRKLAHDLSGICSTDTRCRTMSFTCLPCGTKASGSGVCNTLLAPLKSTSPSLGIAPHSGERCGNSVCMCVCDVGGKPETYNNDRPWNGVAAPITTFTSHRPACCGTRVHTSCAIRSVVTRACACMCSCPNVRHAVPTGLQC